MLTVELGNYNLIFPLTFKWQPGLDIKVSVLKDKMKSSFKTGGSNYNKWEYLLQEDYDLDDILLRTYITLLLTVDLVWL